jgi:hypothetical protein
VKSTGEYDDWRRVSVAFGKLPSLLNLSSIKTGQDGFHSMTWNCVPIH